MGIRHHEQGTAFPCEGISFFVHNTHPRYRYNLHCLCLIKKGYSLCRLKINHTSGSNSCVYSWFTGLLGSEQINWKLFTYIYGIHTVQSFYLVLFIWLYSVLKCIQFYKEDISLFCNQGFLFVVFCGWNIDYVWLKIHCLEKENMVGCGVKFV